MKRIILILFLLITFSCGPLYQLTGDFDNYYIQEQVDSVCKVEKIPQNLDKWSKMTMTDDSTSFYQYMYIKSTDSSQTIWTLTDMDSLYRFKKKTLKITDK